MVGCCGCVLKEKVSWHSCQPLYPRSQQQLLTCPSFSHCHSWLHHSFIAILCVCVLTEKKEKIFSLCSCSLTSYGKGQRCGEGQAQSWCWNVCTITWHLASHIGICLFCLFHWWLLFNFIPFHFFNLFFYKHLLVFFLSNLTKCVAKHVWTCFALDVCVSKVCVSDCVWLWLWVQEELNWVWYLLTLPWNPDVLFLCELILGLVYPD